MSSRLPGAGDLYGNAGGGGTAPPSLHADVSFSAAPKRPASELLDPAQQLLLLRRSVKPKTGRYLQSSPVSPLDLLDPYAFLKQQLLLHHHAAAAATHLRSRLQELERHLLDDSDDPPTSSAPAALPADWDSLLSPASSAQLLMDAAAAVAEGDAPAASAALAAIRCRASRDPEQRLCAHLAAALAARLDARPPAAGDDLCSAEHLAGAQLLLEASPCFKLALHAANLALLDAARGLPTLHVVDFDVGHGLQYLALLDTLAAAPASAAGLALTAVADPDAPYSTNSGAPHLVRAAGERLAKNAEKVGVAFRFRLVTLRPSELTRDALGCGPDDPLAVNLAFHLHKVPDESVTPANPRDELLRRARALHPKVVTLVEQEMSANTTPFLPRLTDAHAYYSALLGSVAAAAGDRSRLEDCLARKAGNAATREGAERVERCEVFGKWRARMGMAGFRPSPLGPPAADSLRSRLAALSGRLADPAAFSVRQDTGGLSFAYSGRILTVASAWH